MTYSKSDKSYDIRRIRQQSIKGQLWSKAHPGYAAERMRRRRELYGREPKEIIKETFNPLVFKSDLCGVISDLHIPFQNKNFVDVMYTTMKKYKVKDLAIVGDFWDCDNYTRFVRLSWGESFKEEINHVKDELNRIVHNFKNVWICRGNHEKRWIDGNNGMMGMKELFNCTGIIEGYEVTLDDHMILKSGDRIWLLCHPRNFRQTPLSVARDLATKYNMNVICAHGHGFASGWDKSGKYYCIDSGGLFDKEALEYLRNTTCYPETRNGFIIIKDGEPMLFYGD